MNKDIKTIIVIGLILMTLQTCTMFQMKSELEGLHKRISYWQEPLGSQLADIADKIDDGKNAVEELRDKIVYGY